LEGWGKEQNHAPSSPIMLRGDAAMPYEGQPSGGAV
jgi:hypothetical protein